MPSDCSGKRKAHKHKFLAGDRAVSRPGGQGSNVLLTIFGTQGTLMFLPGGPARRTGDQGDRTKLYACDPGDPLEPPPEPSKIKSGNPESHTFEPLLIFSGFGGF